MLLRKRNELLRLQARLSAIDSHFNSLSHCSLYGNRLL